MKDDFLRCAGNDWFMMVQGRKEDSCDPCVCYITRSPDKSMGWVLIPPRRWSPPRSWAESRMWIRGWVTGTRAGAEHEGGSPAAYSASYTGYTDCQRERGKIGHLWTSGSEDTVVLNPSERLTKQQDNMLTSSMIRHRSCTPERKTASCCLLR